MPGFKRRYEYVYEFKRGDEVLKGTGKELTTMLGGDNHSLISIISRCNTNGKPVFYRGYSVRRTHKIIPVSVYEAKIQGTNLPAAKGTRKELADKFGIKESSMYRYLNGKQPLRRRGYTYIFKKVGTTEVWKPLQSKDI